MQLSLFERAVVCSALTAGGAIAQPEEREAPRAGSEVADDVPEAADTTEPVPPTDAGPADAD